MAEEKYFVVSTEYGPVQGVRKESALGRDYYNFQGIPYMKAPLGKLRFREAQAPEKWTEPLLVNKEPPSFTAVSFVTYQFEGQEDAGIINVYTPSIDSNNPLPVMVWIYGGGFKGGSSKTDLYGPDFFMQKNVVLVTFNYRLGVFGFLSLEDKELGVPGNAGLKDQTFALQWVKKNIKNFGGNPNNVTLFGESAGGASVHHHMISDYSKGLFHRSIVCSGSAFTSCYALVPRRDFAQRLAKAVGWDGTGGDKTLLEVLESVDAKTLVMTTETLLTPEEKTGENFYTPFGPTVEPYVTGNSFLAKDIVLAAREAWGNDIDTIFSVTSFEGLSFCDDTALVKVAEILPNSDYFAPTQQMPVEISKDKLSEYGTKIKEIYYGKLIPSKTNVESYAHFLSDRFFLHDVQRAILSRVNSNGNGKTFFYRFDYDTGLNFGKILLKKQNYSGTAHGDDLSYIFMHDPACKLNASPKIDDEYQKVKVMIKFFVDYATFGCTQVAGVKLPEITADSPLKCVNIANEKIEVIEFPESGRLKVWDEVYTDAGAALF